MLEVTEEFLKYVDDFVDTGVKYNKKNVYQDIYSKFPTHYRIKMTTFRNWIKLYADWKKQRT